MFVIEFTAFLLHQRFSIYFSSKLRLELFTQSMCQNGLVIIDLLFTRDFRDPMKMIFTLKKSIIFKYSVMELLNCYRVMWRNKFTMSRVKKESFNFALCNKSSVNSKIRIGLFSLEISGFSFVFRCDQSSYSFSSKELTSLLFNKMKNNECSATWNLGIFLK